MKIIVLAFSFILVQSAQAEVPFYVCGYGDLEKVSTLDMLEMDLKDAPLAPSEKDYLESKVDDEWDCDEGVELLGSEIVYKNSDMKVQYMANCSKDSLGTYKVELTLSCYDDYLK